MATTFLKSHLIFHPPEPWKYLRSNDTRDYVIHLTGKKSNKKTF